MDLMDRPCVRVEFRSMPSNAGLVWFNIGSAAINGKCYPLDIGDGKDEIFIDNLNKLKFSFENSEDKIALIYEVQ